MSESLSSRLRCRVSLFARDTEAENALGESTYEYALKRRMWAEIVPASASVRDTEADESYVEYTHKITVRAPCSLQADMYIEYRGKRFDVVSWEPHYKHRDRIIITAKEQVGRDGTGI